MSPSIYPSIFLSIYLSISLFINMSVYIYIYSYVYYLCIYKIYSYVYYLSIHLSIYLYSIDYISVILTISIPLSIHFWSNWHSICLGIPNSWVLGWRRIVYAVTEGESYNGRSSYILFIWNPNGITSPSSSWYHLQVIHTYLSLILSLAI